MQQKEIRSMTAALDLADKAIGGATELGVAGPKYNTAAVLTLSRDGLVGARQAFDAANTELDLRRSVLKSMTETVQQFISTTRNVLKSRIVDDNSSQWSQAGFRRGTRSVPRKVADMKVVVQSVHDYFMANPAAEVGDLNVTAVRAQTLLDGLRTAENAMNSQKTAVGVIKLDRDAKYKALTGQLRDLTKELGQLFDPLDPRWLTFGLNKPGAKQTPDVPANISAVLVGTNAVAVNWGAAPRAEYYRVWVKVNGVDQELVAVGSPADLDFTISGLPANTKIEIAVSAVNNGGESGKSTVVTVTTH